jgi:hypothetical protein
MDSREDQPVKTSTNRIGRITIIILSKPCRRLGSMATGATIPDIATDLLLIAAARQIADAHSRPPELGHELRQASISACCAAALGHLKGVQDRLATHPFQAIKLDLAADTLQRCQPRIGDRLRSSQVLHASRACRGADPVGVRQCLDPGRFVPRTGCYRLWAAPDAQACRLRRDAGVRRVQPLRPDAAARVVFRPSAARCASSSLAQYMDRDCFGALYLRYRRRARHAASRRSPRAMKRQNRRQQMQIRKLTFAAIACGSSVRLSTMK